jgi:predicted ATP-dependent endonuclease of OLD family
MTESKILSIRLKSFKVFNDVSLEFNACNVFVGPNASGKSIIGEFLSFFKDLINYSLGYKNNFDKLVFFLKNSFQIGRELPIEYEIVNQINEYNYFYRAVLYNQHNYMRIGLC